MFIYVYIILWNISIKKMKYMGGKNAKQLVFIEHIIGGLERVQ